jgi:3-oxoacyl-[acyl-carrier protein] reductase
MRNPISLITGSTQGIGKATSLGLAAAGSDIILNSRFADESAAKALSAVKAEGVSAIHIPADISDPNALSALVQQAWDWQGQVDLWVNNAGADVLSGPKWRQPWEERLQQLIVTDLWGVIRSSQWVGGRMKEQGFGQVINIGWDQAESGGVSSESGLLFSLIKGGIMAYTRNLASALAPTVRVNCVAPGWIATEWGQRITPRLYETIQNQIPMGRWGTPEDVANAIVWLASPATGFITGQTLYVNGGSITQRSN